MKTSVKNTFAFLFCTFALGAASANAQKTSQQSDQVAIQLGAIQLGIADLETANAQERTNALAQGRLALGATKANYATTAFVVGAAPPAPQSQTFRDQLQQAALAALQNPVDLSVNGVAPLANDKTVSVVAQLDPALTSASKVFDFVAKRLPNIPPGLVIDAISSSVAGNFGSPGSGPADANLLAEFAMKIGLRNYISGTTQWPGVSAATPSLPNFSPGTVNGVAPSLNGLMDAASAIAANSINALRDALGTDDPDAIAAMTASLMKGAAEFQLTSVSSKRKQPAPRYGGTASATATGLVAQLAGEKESDWTNATTGDLLNAVVSGAMTGARAQRIPVAYGVAAGFAGTFLATGGNSADFDINEVADDILASFEAAGGVKPRHVARVTQAIMDGLNAGLDQANWADPVNGIAGIGGIKDFTVINGSGTPLTDTVGL